MTTTTAKHRRAEFPPRWVLFICILAIAAGLALMWVSEQQAMQDAVDARANAETLAAEVRQGRSCRPSRPARSRWPWCAGCAWPGRRPRSCRQGLNHPWPGRRARQPWRRRR